MLIKKLKFNSPMNPAKTEAGDRAYPVLGNALLTLALLIMLIHVLIYLAYGIALIPFPFDYDQAEGYELNNAILMSRGKCPYCDNDGYPFYGSGYPPVFHILMVPFVWVFGPDFWYGRLIIFASTFITAFAIGWAVYRQENRVWIAVLAGGAFLASNTIYHIGPLLRQHLLMVMFETLAVVVIANAFDLDRDARRRRLFWGFLLLLIAGYTKQLAYATCIAVFVWVFIRNPRAAIIYGAGLMIGAAAIFLGWMILTDGEFYKNIILSNQNPYITDQFVGLAKQFLRLHWPLLLLASLMALYELYLARLSVYAIWYIAALANTVGSGKWGAGDSYFATALAATCILSGIFTARALNDRWHFPEKRYTLKLFPDGARFPGEYRQAYLQVVGICALGLFVVYGLTVVKMPTSGAIFGPLSDLLGIRPLPAWRYPLYDAAGWTVGYAVTGHFPSPEDYENGWKLAQKVKETEGLVLSEDAGFSIKAGQEVITNSVQLNNLWEQGLYDPANLVELIENRAFGLIILRAGFFPDPVLKAIESHYTIDERIPMNGFEYNLWKPQQENRSANNQTVDR